jgi:hypothetical protein
VVRRRLGSEWTVCADVLCASVSSTEVQLLCIVIVCTSAIAVLNWELGFGNICVYMALGNFWKRF